ncbi:unnamed protein product [Cyclocybe aegerita]|uniref:Uncharacterized protein n=1 Tax=Cyclocybe aegerita TaxID=1973307 RepID=A0A8S0VZ30_CYCAE|nr:unnamed protein product [Cyclocybe aegerita]
MKFAISTAVLYLAGLVASASVLPCQSCLQATRFGILTVSSPTGATSYNPGDDIHIKVDLTCTVNYFGIVPTYLNYTIVVPASENNGHEPPIVLAHHMILAGSLSDEFSTQIPYAFYFSGTPYTVVFTNTYPINGTDGSQVLIQGGLSQVTAVAPPFLGCVIVATDNVITLSWVFILIWDTLSLFLMVIPAAKAYNFGSGSQSVLFKTIYSKGITYYFYMFVLSTVNLLLSWNILIPAPYQFLAVGMSRSLHAVFTSRVLLHIRAQSSRTETYRPDDSFQLLEDMGPRKPMRLQRASVGLCFKFPSMSRNTPAARSNYISS